MSASTSWVNHVPQSWRVVKLKIAGTYMVSNVDKLSAEDELPVRLCNYNDVYKNDYITPDMDFMRATALPREIKKFGLRDGDVVITKDSETWDDIGIPALVRKSAPDLVCGYHLAILRGKVGSLSGEFLFRCLQSKTIRIQLELAANGVTRYGIANDEIGRILLPIPPVKTQGRIADFLDRETARIDGLIELKVEMLRLLEEKRTSLISQVITRGLNQKTKLCDSGIPWIGKIPAHWSVSKIKFIAKRGRNTFTDGDWIETPFVTDTGVRLIQCGNVGTGVYEEQGFRFISEETFEELNCSEVLPNDVLICRMRSSPRILAGRACLAPNLGCRMVTAVDNCILRPSSEHDPRYVVYQMTMPAYLGFVEEIARGGTRDRISRAMLADFKIATPPKAEQKTIADYLDKTAGRMSQLSEKINSSVTLLREYRTALITAAVTGKIDVKNS